MEVEPGDEFPYVPQHQLAASTGLSSERWGDLTVGATFVDEMRETAGQGEPLPGEVTDAFVVFDALASLRVTDEIAIYGKVENLLNQDYIVSRRPFGARPGRPRLVYGGVKIKIGKP